jgi:hypothetical protein|nr:MAG TPA: hypothetical protein [Caudoviricetes sp.]
MTLEDVKSMIYDITAEFFCGATVIWAEQINTKPETPYITLKLGGIRKTLFPLVNGDERAYSCSTTLEVNLYTKGKAITVAERVTGNYINTATSDLFDYFSFIESDVIVDRLAEYGLDITLEPPIRDLTALQNDSKYRYRAMAEATVSFIQNANGPYGVGGRTLPNASGGGTVEMSNTITDIIEEADIKEKNYEGGN